MRNVVFFTAFSIKPVFSFDGRLIYHYVLRYKYDSMFDSLNPIDGKVTGASAKGEPGLPIFQIQEFVEKTIFRRDDQVKIAQQCSWKNLEVE